MADISQIKLTNGVTYDFKDYDIRYTLAKNSQNLIYRGKFLNCTVEALSQSVGMRKYIDLYLGDYITVTITTTLPNGSKVTENVDLMIAGFDIFPVNAPHVVLIPKVCFKTPAQMNTTLTAQGGYYNSYMHKTVLPCYAKSLNAALGNYLFTFKEYLSNTINTSIFSAAGGGGQGGSTNWAQYDCQLVLPSEPQLYGARLFSSGGHDVGQASKLLPVFNHIPIVDPSETKHMWLRSVIGLQEFSVCGKDGGAGFGGATQSYGVRPLMAFGMP